jgi:hypothetical protein
MNRFTIRVSPALKATITSGAKAQGVTLSAHIIRLLERGSAVDALENLVDAAAVEGASRFPLPVELKRLLKPIARAAFHAEEHSKGLSPLVNRSTSEVGRLAAAARDRADARVRELFGDDGT